MDPQAILLGGVSAVTGALVYVANLLWKKQEQCEQDRVSLRSVIEAVKTENGRALGVLDIMQRCPEDECPFRQPKPTVTTTTTKTNP